MAQSEDLFAIGIQTKNTTKFRCALEELKRLSRCIGVEWGERKALEDIHDEKFIEKIQSEAFEKGKAEGQRIKLDALIEDQKVQYEKGKQAGRKEGFHCRDCPECSKVFIEQTDKVATLTADNEKEHNLNKLYIQDNIKLKADKERLEKELAELKPANSAMQIANIIGAKSNVGYMERVVELEKDKSQLEQALKSKGITCLNIATKEQVEYVQKVEKERDEHIKNGIARNRRCEKVEKQNKILTVAWESVIKNDKTPEYAYPHGGESIEAQQNNCGELPKGKDERWQTPREIAQQVLNDAKRALKDAGEKP
jgi:hypothetical protein